MYRKPSAFFAYPSVPSTIPESIRGAVKSINKSQKCHATVWQDCDVSGKLIIETILKSIDDADVFCADLTTFNENVLFELGYAIAQDKRAWLLLDTSRKGTEQTFQRLRILTTIGYSDYRNSQDIADNFLSDAVALQTELDKSSSGIRI